MCAKFQLSRLILILSAVNSYWQLLTADDSRHKKNLNGIFIYPLKLIPVPNFSSLGWFSFLSAVNSCWQLLTADDSCHKKILYGIFIYPLNLIPLPNFSSLGWVSFLSAFKAVFSCWQMIQKTKWGFHPISKFDICIKFELCRLLGGPAREYDRQTPPPPPQCENRDKFSPV